MSALTSKADISRRHLNVRFVPIADIPTFIRSVAPLISTYRHPAAMAA